MLLFALLSSILFSSCSSTTSSDSNFQDNTQMTEFANMSVKEVSEQEYRQAALNQYGLWIESWDYFTDGIPFEKLLTQAKEDLGEDNRIVRIMQYGYDAMLFEMENPDAANAVFEMLALDSAEQPIVFIDDSSCAVVSGISSPQIAYDLSTGYRGLYDTSTQQFILPAEYIYLYNCGNDLLCISEDGYYGCVDLHGNKVIGLYYEEPLYFNDGIAVVKTNEKYGAIDFEGNTVLQPVYSNVQILDHLISADAAERHYEEHPESSAIALFDRSGNQLTDHDYGKIVLLDLTNNNEQRVFAMWNRDAMEKEETNTGDWYDLFDPYGTRLIGEGTSLQEVWGVQLPDSWGIMIAECHGKVVNSFGAEYPQHGPYYDTFCYTYISEDLQRVTSNYYYRGVVTQFNKKGYAIASIEQVAYEGFFGKDYESDQRMIIHIRQGEIELFSSTEDGFMPCDANDYVYKMDYEKYGGGRYALYIRSSGDIIEYNSISLCDGTNMTIVQNEESGLYGLYDGNALALDIVYNSMEFDGEKVIATRGAETKEYSPGIG